MLSTQQCLQVLGLPSGASKDQIKQAYHDLVKVWHPDRFAHDPRLQKQAEEKLKDINEAHDVLMGSHPQTHRATPRPAQRTYASSSRKPRPKDKYWMMPVISFIVLLIAIAIVSMVFHIFGRDYEPVHPQRSAQELM